MKWKMSKEKDDFDELGKKCDRWGKIVLVQFIFWVMFAIIVLVLDYYINYGGLDTMEKFFEEIGEIIVGAIAGGTVGFLGSIIFNTIFYHKHLKHIPEACKEKINQILNDRLNYETSNHNALRDSLTPNNQGLLNLISKEISKEHSYRAQEHSKLGKHIEFIRDKAIKDSKKYKNMNVQQSELKGLQEKVTAVLEQNIKLVTENGELRARLMQMEQILAVYQNELNSDKIIGQEKGEWER